MAIPDMKTIGDTIKALRKAKNLKQGELAKRLKMTSAQLCRIEGSKNAPSIKTLARVARALNVSLSELMSDPVSEEPKPVVCSSDATRAYGAPQTDIDADKELSPIRETDDSEEDIKRIKSQIKAKLVAYAQIEEELGLANSTTLPLSFTFSTDERGAEILASTLRNACGIGTMPFSDLPSFLEEKNVRLVQVRAPIEIQSRSFLNQAVTFS